MLDCVHRVLATGMPFALPTDTVYGLACAYDNPQAIRALYRVKGRPVGKAIPVLLGAMSQLPLVAPASRTDLTAQLMARFWPGPLTIILEAHPALPAALLADGTTVAVRVVDNPVFQAIALRMGPLATTSANLSGQSDCSRASDVLAQLQGRIPLIVDGGPTPETQPSTIVAVANDGITVIREGSLSTAIRTAISAPD